MIILIILIGMGMFVFYWLAWLEHCKDYPRIKLKDFKKFYALNPERWHMRGCHVGCKTSSCRYEYFQFGFVDFGRYLAWQHKIDKNHKAKAHMEATQRMMDAVKEDIAAAKEKENANQVVTAFKILEELRKMNMDDECPSLVELLKKYDIE